MTKVIGPFISYYALGLSKAIGVVISSSELQCINTSPGGEALGVLNLKGCWAGRLTQGCPGPLAFTLLSNMAWAMALLPSCIVIGLAVR